MATKTNLQGKKFGKLTVVSFSHIHGSHAYWNCVCDCGKPRVVCGSAMMTGKTKSCGCIGREVSRKRMSTKNGYSKTRVYRIFIGMKLRCYKKTDKDYPRYGGRGITICDEWLKDSRSFVDWALQHGYADDLSIDRIDVNGNYSPENCRWVSAKKQANNRRSNLLITYAGKTLSASEWCAIKGWNRHVIPERLRKGWSLEKAMNTPLRIRGGNKNGKQCI